MEEAFDVVEISAFVGGDECDGSPVVAGACRASYAVDVVFDVAWHVVVDYGAYVVDVDAATDDVGGY